MAARLPVVVSQSLRRDPSAVTCEEDLVTELLFTTGLDATLIGPLETIQAGSTDHLCLEGLKGPFALLTWGEVSKSRQELLRLGIHGSLCDRDSDSFSVVFIAESESMNHDRRIDHYQLRRETKPSHLIAQLKQTLVSQDVKAFQIQGIGKATPIPLVSKTASHGQRGDSAIDVVDVKSIEIPKLIELDSDEEGWVHLDILMDDLDQADV